MILAVARSQIGEAVAAVLMFCHAIWLARAINLLKTDTSMHSFLAVFSFQCSVATNISPKQPCESSEASVAFVLLVIFVARAECYHRWYTYRFFCYALFL